MKTELRKAGSTIVFDSPIFNEFVVQFPAGSKVVYHQLLEKKIVGGLPLESYYPEMADRYLLCATETSSKADMDALVKEVTSCTM